VNLILHYGDKPGALGKIGTLLGAAEVNIEAAQLSQDAAGGGATVMLRVDRDVPVDVQAAIRDAVEATLVETVDLS
jgi:D-3-phosphoglycerate dehydrogenase